MNCKRCNEKLALFSNYCENCSEKAPSVKEWWQFIGASFIAFLKKRVWLTVAVVGVLVFSIGFSILWGAITEFDPTDYIITHTTGYDQNGYLSFEIDYPALCEKVLGREPNPETKRGYEKHAEYLKKAETLENTLRVTADRTSGLKNGDYFIITVSISDTELYKSYGINCKDDIYSKTLKVGKDCDPFDTPIAINLFDYIDVSFSGENGNGQFVINNETKETVLNYASGNTVTMNTQCYKSWGEYNMYVSLKEIGDGVLISVNVSQDSDLTNGEMIMLILNESDLVDLSRLGINVTESQNTYTVSGLTE